MQHFLVLVNEEEVDQNH